MILERKLKIKRGLFGYSPKQVKVKIEEFQKQYHGEQELLEQQIRTEKLKNLRLKERVSKYANQPNHSEISSSIGETLLKQFFEQTRSVHELKRMLAAEEVFLQDELVKKTQAKELAQKQMQEAIDYLNNLKNELKKELTYK